MSTPNASNWQALLTDAANKPGKILQGYTLFHNYSMGNALEVIWQCSFRGIELGPINTYNGWKELGRQVRKGEKAIWLWMPVTCKGKQRDTSTGEETEHTFTRFVYKPYWFVLSQTDGPEVQPPTVPGFDLDTALAALGVTRIPFDETDGNIQGFAKARSIAVSAIAELPIKTTFHEVAHVLLGHTAENEMSDDDRTPKDIREAEAEAVALICCESLGLPGVEYSRGYIQHWLKGNTIPEKSAQKIFSTASKILSAGRAAISEQSEVAA